MTNERNVNRYVYSFNEVAETYRAGAIRGDFIGGGHQDVFRSAKASVTWSGGTVDEVLHYLANGFVPPERELRGMPVALDAEGIAWKFNDEDGDYEHDLFISGESEYYLDRRTVPQKPGIHVYAEIWFCGATPNEVVAEFGEWTASALSAINAMGYDVSLQVMARTQSLHTNTHGDIDEHVIVVKRFGEVMIPKDFLVLFSACGLRHLVFTAMNIPERDGAGPNKGCGRLLEGSDWGVDWDEDARSLNFTCKQMAHEFPREFMDESLAEVAERF